MNPNEVKGINDLEVWLSENLSQFQSHHFVESWARNVRHAINYDFMVGATRIQTEVKELSMVPEGWKLVLHCEALGALLEGMKIDPVTVVGYFKTDSTGRIDGWQWVEVIR
jgi:hypothetical protein